MAHVVYARIQTYHKVYIEDEEADGKTDAEIEEIARRKIMEFGEDVLCEDDGMDFEPEADILEIFYGYEFPD